MAAGEGGGAALLNRESRSRSRSREARSRALGHSSTSERRVRMASSEMMPERGARAEEATLTIEAQRGVERGSASHSASS